MYLERFRLDGRTAFVTGGASGIGWCAADALAEAGAKVVIADLTRDALDAAIAALAAKGHTVEGLIMDVTDSAQVTEVAASTSSSTTPASRSARSTPRT